MSDEREEYEAPALTVVGSIAEWTAFGGGIGAGGGIGISIIIQP